MNSNKYNVLWFDDQFYDENMQEIADKAYDKYSIILTGFESADAGIKYLVDNFKFIDAILLDARFYLNEGDISGTEDLKGLRKVWDKIIQLEAQGIALPKFIFSGQPKLDQDQTFKDTYGTFYSKHDPEDLDKLFRDIIQAADLRIETLIRHEYSKVFDVCTDKYIGTAAAKDLLTILKKENTISAFVDPDLYFNPLRKIIEDFFNACNKWGLLPDIFIQGGLPAFNESSKFLSGGIEKGYQLDCPVFPKVISDNVRNVLSVCQPASHRLEIDLFVSKVNSPYLLLSVVYQLLDVILWFKIYTDENSEVDLNKTRYKRIESGLESGIIDGIIEKDSNRNYHCGDIVLTYKHVKDNNYSEGDKIRIVKTAINSNENTKQLYSKSAIISERI